VQKEYLHTRKIREDSKFLRINTPPDISAQVGNHNWNTALHLAFKMNYYKAVIVLLTQGTELLITMVI